MTLFKVTMTRIVVKGMKIRQKGAIVNISSGSELQPIPYCTLYSASKVKFQFCFSHDTIEI